jgi:ComF family protein
LGFYLGYLYGTKLKKDFPNLLAQINILMPVPLSKKKKLARGYNQSEMIAKGLSKATGIRMETSFLKRIRSKGSQTKEGRFERWLNVKSVYDCEKFPQEWKHIALVDDVITTGSTIGACMESVIKLNKVDISVLCLGYTNS